MATMSKYFDVRTSMVNDEALLDTMLYLDERWFDESEYEDISTYAKPLAGPLKKYGATVVRMSAAPALSAVIRFEGEARRWRLRIKRRGNAVCLRLEPASSISRN